MNYAYQSTFIRLLWHSLVVMNTTLKVNPLKYPIAVTTFLLESPVLMAKFLVNLIARVGRARLPSLTAPQKGGLPLEARPDAPVDITNCHKQEEALKLELLQGKKSQQQRISIKRIITGLPMLTSPVSM